MTHKMDSSLRSLYRRKHNVAALQRTFGDHYLYAGVGDDTELGRTRRRNRIDAQPVVMDEGRLRTYRTLLTLRR